MGKVGKGVGCEVQGCGNQAQRSLSRTELGSSGLKVSGEGRRVYLCHDHYKEWKKATRSTRTLERSRW